MANSSTVYGRLDEAFIKIMIEELAQYASVPVWNGLTNEYHPTQVLADLQTMMEHSDKPLNQVKFAYLGDARFNMGNSLLVGAAKMGMDFRSVAPESVQPNRELVDEALEISRETGAKITITDDLESGVKNCDFLVTDVWVSMGEPEDVWKERIELLKPYQVNETAMKKTGSAMPVTPAAIWKGVNTPAGWPVMSATKTGPPRRARLSKPGQRSCSHGSTHGRPMARAVP